MTAGSEPLVGIRVYGTSWCPQCWTAKDVFRRDRIEIEWVDIDSDSDGEAFVVQHNQGMRSVPTIIFPDGSILVEPSRPQLQAKIDSVRGPAA
jgi:glutaredoxin